jgi:hypothetical protein
MGNFNKQKENSYADVSNINRLTNSSKTADDGMLGGKAGDFLGSLQAGQGQTSYNSTSVGNNVNRMVSNLR